MAIVTFEEPTADAGGLVMGHYDRAGPPLWTVAKEFTLADNFFMGAFGAKFGLTDSMTTIITFLAILTGGQALINHYGIALTAKLTDFSGYLIFGGSILLAVGMGNGRVDLYRAIGSAQSQGGY